MSRIVPRDQSRLDRLTRYYDLAVFHDRSQRAIDRLAELIEREKEKPILVDDDAGAAEVDRLCAGIDKKAKRQDAIFLFLAGAVGFAAGAILL